MHFSNFKSPQANEIRVQRIYVKRAFSWENAAMTVASTRIYTDIKGRKPQATAGMWDEMLQSSARNTTATENYKLGDQQQIGGNENALNENWISPTTLSALKINGW